MQTKHLSIVLLILFLMGCAETQESVDSIENTTTDSTETSIENNVTDGCVSEYDDTADYFPNKAELTHTAGFTVEYENNYKVVTVLSPYAGAEESVQYVLVQCGTPAPDGFDGATIVEVPIESIVSMSTVYLPTLEAIGRLDALVGVDTSLYATNETVLGMAEAGELVEIGSGAEVNVEAAIELNPDLIMTSASGSPEYDAHPKLQEAGLNVALNAELLDTSPLGRAEWVDFVALFFNEESTAEAWFADVVTEYDELVALTADLDGEERPTVFANTPYQDTWYMPGGNSYVAQFFADAGADYLWSDDDATGSLFLDFETVIDRAIDADVWLNIGFFNALEDLSAADSRYAEFSAFTEGNVYNNDARTTDSGGNDYYESAIIYPNDVLADLIKIFHPDLLPEHQFVYYRPVE